MQSVSRLGTRFIRLDFSDTNFWLKFSENNLGHFNRLENKYYMQMKCAMHIARKHVFVILCKIALDVEYVTYWSQQIRTLLGLTR